MLSLNSAWGTNFFPTQLNPQDLAVMVFAGAMNLTGARPVIEQAYRAESSRAAVVARPFADCAQYVQRDYRLQPEHRIAILGNSQACHAVITDASGEVVYDPHEGQRMGYIPGVVFSYGDPERDFSADYGVMAEISYSDALDVLKQSGKWIDNSLSLRVDSARAQDWL